jgi:hypothetical protein
MNVTLMEEIRQQIMMYPGNHSQLSWAGGESLSRKVPVSKLLDLGNHPCGTTVCVAGWAAILTAPKKAYVYDNYLWVGRKQYAIGDIAQKAMGLTSAQANWLFNPYRGQDAVLWALKWLPDHQDADAADLSVAWGEEWS